MEESDYLNLNQISIQGDISLQHIIDIEIKREINRHTELTIIGIIDEKEKDTYIDKIHYGAEINLNYGEGITDKLFGGIIVHVELKEYKRSYYAVIKAKSASYLMDQKLKKRSFNKINMTYDDILNIISNDYAQGTFLSNDKAGQNIESLIIQYDETDFEFLKRTASRLGLVIAPEDLFNLPRIYFGISTRNSVELNTGDYEFIRYFDSFTEEKYEYKIITGQVLEIGCEVVLGNQRFIVVKCESKLVDSELKNTYTILDSRQIEVPRICNENIRGTAIEGTVMEVQGTEVRVQLDIDNEAITNWYEVIVGSNNALYSMPYEGDRVKVYFESSEEAESSVNFTTYSGEGLNPDTKFWSTKDGEKVEFTPGSIEISAQSDTLNSIKLTDSSGIDIKSGLKITLRSAGAISLSASSISIIGSNAVSLNHYPDPKVKNTGIPKGITIDSTDVSFKVEDAYFEGKEKKSYPIEAEPEPAFSEPPKAIEEKKTTSSTVVGQKNEARVESGNKTLLKGLGIAALALGMAALTVVTGGAALAVAGALMEGGLISTAIGAGVAVGAGVGIGMGLEGAAMEANVAEATVEEGNNEINNGNQGIDEKGYNRIRDGEFGGDEEAYQEYQDKAIGLWETGVMINMTAATVGTEALPVAGVADMYLSSKLPNLSNMFAPEEEELICSSNPLLETEGEKNEANLSADGPKISNEIKEVLSENNISIDEFQRMKLTPVDELTDREKNILYYIRESIDKPTSDTVMSKVLPVDNINGYLKEDNPYTTVGGYVAKYDDVKKTGTAYSDMRETLRVDYKDDKGNYAYPEDGNAYAVIRFKYKNVEDDLIDIPYGTEFYGKNTDPDPCTRNGFLGGRNDTIVPEWYVKDYAKGELQEGAKMYQVIDGKEEVIAIFKSGRFVPIK